MKFEKVEDLRKLPWRCLTEEEWKGLLIEDNAIVGEHVMGGAIIELAEDKFREIARKTSLPTGNVVSFLKKENATFYRTVGGYYETIVFKQFRALRNLLKIPDISDEQSLLKQFEQLTEKQKAHFVAEIWKDYIAPKLPELVRNERKE